MVSKHRIERAQTEDEKAVLFYEIVMEAEPDTHHLLCEGDVWVFNIGEVYNGQITVSGETCRLEMFYTKTGKLSIYREETLMEAYEREMENIDVVKILGVPVRYEGKVKPKELEQYVRRGICKYAMRLKSINVTVDGAFVDIEYETVQTPFERIRRITGV